MIAPTGAPQSVTYNTTSSTTLNITWQPPPLDQRNGIIVYYKVRLIEMETNVSSVYNSSYLYIYLTGLHPYYTYIITFAAVTIQEGPFGSTTYVTMPEDGKC